MNGHQGGRTGCIDRNSGTFQIEKIRNAGGANGEAVSGIGKFRVLLLQQDSILITHNAHIDATFLVAQRLRTVAGVFKGFVSFLQKQPMLGIHAFGFRR